jgi:putative FmdB family regulatory protein
MYYKFHCNACNKDIELSLKVADLPNAVCCECGSGDVERIWSGLPQFWNCDGGYSSGKKG